MTSKKTKTHNWEIKKLGEVTTVIAGQSPEGKYYNNTGKGLPFYQGKKEFTEKYIGEPTTWTTETTKEAVKDDILMSVRAPVGPVNFSTQKICIGRGLAAIRTSNKIDKEFLFNFLIKHESEIVGNTGAVFNSISKTQIEEIPIPLPLLSEQKRIVAILDKAFTAIAKAKENAEKNLANARDLFESYLQGVFANRGDGWDEKTLGEVCEIKGGGTPSKSNKSFWIGAIPWVSPKDMKQKNISDAQDHISQAALDSSATNLIPEDSLLIVVRSGILAHTIPFGITRTPVTINQDMKALIPSEKLNTEFLYYHLYGIHNKLLAIASRGATVHRIPAELLENIHIYFPLLPEQKRIVSELDALSAETKRLEEIYKQKIADMDELKKSILEKAFKGEL